jgi:hypothetical protein
MRKRRLARLWLLGLLLCLLTLDGWADHSPALSGRTSLDSGLAHPAATSTLTPLTESELNALSQFEDRLREQGDLPSRPDAELARPDPSAVPIVRHCAREFDTAYQWSRLQDRRLAQIISGSTVTGTAVAYSDVDDPCLIIIAHQLLFGRQPDPPDRPPQTQPGREQE